MVVLRLVNFDGLKHVLVPLIIVLLVACSGGDGSSILGTGSASAVLSWAAPSTREDNSELKLSEIAGYRIYYGVETGKYVGVINVDDPTATENKLTGIPSGAYFVAMTTIDVDGRESVFSQEVVATI